MQSCQDGESSVTSSDSLHHPRPQGARLVPLRTSTRLRRPVALGLTVLLLLNIALPALAEDAPTSFQTTGAQSGPLPSPNPATLTFSVKTFQVNRFTGAATAEIPILPPPGTADTTPQIVLRYDSSIVDELGGRQALGAGLGWTLDTGGFVFRDTKLDADPTNDTFTLVFGGESHDLVLVDGSQNIYHTKDETFWRLQYNAAQDYWTLTTKDGTLHRFGSTSDSKAIAFNQGSMTPVTYKYFLAEVQTTRGTAVRYTYAKQAGIFRGSATYDQAVYPDRITYTYFNGTLVGPAREVRFLRLPRDDWTDNSGAGGLSFHQLERLDAIEVRVGQDLVRRYAFTYDYSIDRDPNTIWQGGASGDLTLKEIRLYGADGVSTLPPLTLTYSGALLGSASSGIGGTVTYVYEEVGTALPRNRVYQRTVTDGRGVTSTTTFTYGPWVVRESTEFRGHAWVRAANALGHYTEISFYQDDALKGRVSRVETRSSAGALFTQVINTWSVLTPFPGVTFAALTQVDTSTFDGDATSKQTTVQYTYDTYGNITAATQSGTGTAPRTDRADFFYNTAAYIVGLPAHAWTTEGVSGARRAESWFFYDGATSYTTPPTQGNLTRVESWLNGGTNPAVTLDYDPYGNITRITDARNFSAVITYHVTFQTFPETIRTPPTPNAPDGLLTRFVFDPKWGLPLEITDPNGHRATALYDPFGRLTRLTGPLDTTSTYGTVSLEYLDLGSLTSQRILTRRTTVSGTANHLWSEVYFDGLGRPYKTRKQAAGSQVSVEETVYDERGLVRQTSLPRFETDPAQWITRTYDPVRRLSRVDYPDTASETFTYSDWVTLATDRRGHCRESTRDAFGRVVQIREQTTATVVGCALGARTTYAYDILGRVTSVTDAANNVTSMVYDTLGRKTQMAEPNLGTWTYGYDASGNLTSQTDAKGQRLDFGYDGLNRLERKRYPDGFEGTWSYDIGTNGRGHLTGMTDLASSASYAYDPLGRQISATRLLDNVTYTTQATYNTLDQITSLTYPDGEVVPYAYDSGGQVFSVGGYVNSMTYNAAGKLTAIQYTNGVTTTSTYDPKTERLLRKQTSTPASESSGVTYIQDLSYAYDTLGNITAITDNRASTDNEAFGYDSLDRLGSATGSYGTHSYSYTNTGNILNKAGVTYTYNAVAQPCNRPLSHAVSTTSDGKTYTYDCNGNLLSDGERTVTWDADNKPVSITRTGVGTTSFVYSGKGARLKKVSPSRTIRYVGNFEDHVTENTRVKQIFAGPFRVATKVNGGPNAGTYFIHEDHLGSLSVLTNSAGTEVQRLRYIPFGETHSNTGTVDFDPYRYTGQALDPETGLYYYGARYYNPTLARFLSPDPIVADPGDPQSLNRYSYARNNPLRFTDPSGTNTSGDEEQDESSGGQGWGGGEGNADVGNVSGIGDLDFSGSNPETDCPCPEDKPALVAGPATPTPSKGCPCKGTDIDAPPGTPTPSPEYSKELGIIDEIAPEPVPDAPPADKEPAPEFGGKGESGGVGAGAASPSPSAKSSPARSPRSPALAPPGIPAIARVLGVLAGLNLAATGALVGKHALQSAAAVMQSMPKEAVHLGLVGLALSPHALQVAGILSLTGVIGIGVAVVGLAVIGYAVFGRR